MRTATVTRPPRAWTVMIAGVAACTVGLAGCAATPPAATTAADPLGTPEPVERLQLMAPADPGGGWDQTARAFAEAAESTGAVEATQVSNVPGAGGTVGLAELADERSEDYLMMTGLVMVGAVETNASKATLGDTTPIARLTAEDLAVAVPADSPYQTVDDLVADIEARGTEVTVSGGSAGGADHILAGLIMQDAGVAIEKLNYVPFSGGAESVTALLGGEVSAGISGVGEYREQVDAGALRVLATSGRNSIEGLGAPTLIQAGYDVELSNWRGVVAPAGISFEGRQRLLAMVEQVQDSDEWQQELEARGWSGTYLAGFDFETFLVQERARVRVLLEDIGLV